MEQYIKNECIIKSNFERNTQNKGSVYVCMEETRNQKETRKYKTACRKYAFPRIYIFTQIAARNENQLTMGISFTDVYPL